MSQQTRAGRTLEGSLGLRRRRPMKPSTKTFATVMTRSARTCAGSRWKMTDGEKTCADSRWKTTDGVRTCADSRWKTTDAEWR